MDIYRLGMWNNKDRDWEGDRVYTYENPIITLDKGAIYIYNTVQVRQLVGLLRYALQNRDADVVLLAGMYSLADNDRPGLWGEYNVTGLNDALDYLGCFRGIR